MPSTSWTVVLECFSCCFPFKIPEAKSKFNFSCSACHPTIKRKRAPCAFFPLQDRYLRPFCGPILGSNLEKGDIFPPIYLCFYGASGGRSLTWIGHLADTVRWAGSFPRSIKFMMRRFATERPKTLLLGSFSSFPGRSLRLAFPLPRPPWIAPPPLLLFLSTLSIPRCDLSSISLAKDVISGFGFDLFFFVFFFFLFLCGKVLRSVSVSLFTMQNDRLFYQSKGAIFRWSN